MAALIIRNENTVQEITDQKLAVVDSERDLGEIRLPYNSRDDRCNQILHQRRYHRPKSGANHNCYRKIDYITAK